MEAAMWLVLLLVALALPTAVAMFGMSTRLDRRTPPTGEEPYMGL
jgi:hypothetical protein